MYRSEQGIHVARLQARTLQRYYPLFRAFISNLPTTIVIPSVGSDRKRVLTEADLAGYLLTEAGLEVDEAKIDLPFDAARKGLKGFAYVVFDTDSDLVRAIELNGRNFHGRDLSVSLLPI